MLTYACYPCLARYIGIRTPDGIVEYVNSEYAEEAIGPPDRDVWGDTPYVDVPDQIAEQLEEVPVELSRPRFVPTQEQIDACKVRRGLRELLPNFGCQVARLASNP